MTASAFTSTDLPTMETALAVVAKMSDIPARKRRRWTQRFLKSMRLVRDRPRRANRSSCALEPEIPEIVPGKARGKPKANCKCKTFGQMRSGPRSL